MNGLPFEQQLLLALQTVTLVGLCLRLWWTGLHRTYPYLFGYLLLALIQTAILSFLPLQSAMYLYVWMATEGLIVCFYALVVLETYSNVLSDMAGIASVARRYIRLTLGLAVLVSLLLVGMEHTPATLVQYFLVCDRAIISSLLVFVLAFLVFLVYYPIPLNRNVVIYSIGFAVYLLLKAAALLANNYMRFQQWSRQINSVFVGASVACLLFWLFKLNQMGETKTVVVGHQWNPRDEQRLITQLQAINESLLRAPKK
jgi:hypothetical protein